MSSGGRGLSPGGTRLGRIARGVIEQEPEYGNVRVLVADAADGALQRLLAPLEVPIDVVPDPAALLQRIRKRKPDLVLISIDTEIDAVAVLRAVRRDAAIDNIPVIVVGAPEHEAVAVAALAAGADDFLKHPVSAGVLHERMRYALAVAELIRRISTVRADVRAAREAERGARDERDDMRAAAERATELERVKRDVLGLAAHELRAHLALARGRLAAVGETAVTSGDAGGDALAVADALVPLGGVLTRMARLVDAMSAAAELEETSPDMDVAVVDLHEVVRAAIGDVASSSAGASVSLAAADRPFFVAVDEQQIRDVVASLVEYAMISGADGDSVRVSVGMNPADHAATVAVTGRASHDRNGGGPRLRSAFSRSLGRDADSQPGIAHLLGKVVARFHGGELEADSAGDSETTMTLRIPLAGPRPRTTVLGGEVELG